MRPHMVRGFHRIAPLFVLVLAVVAMLAACASKPATTEAPGQPLPGPPTSAPGAGRMEPPAPAAPPGVAAPAPTTPQGAAPPTKPPPTPAPEKPMLPEATTYFVHTVQYPGETVSIIAAWYLGDKMRYDVLAVANPEIKPTLIKLGMKIRIPENKMKTRELMPKEFVDSFYGRSRPGKPISSEPPTEKEEERQLFGPKESPPK